MDEEELCLDILKKSYSKFQRKYDFPDFDKMNSEFQIEKVAEVETDFLIREIRKVVSEKSTTYLRFIETLLHPVGVPMFVFSIIKSLGVGEKEKLTEMYKELARIEVDLIELDVEFNEEKEAKFVKDSYEVWEKIKPNFLNVIEAIKRNWDNKLETNGKSYFG